LVNESESLSRLYVMPLHLINTSLLLFSEVMTAEHLWTGGTPLLCKNARVRRTMVIGTATLLLLLTTGAIAALGSHLAPASSLMAGLADDVSRNSHPAVRLRVIHPVLGLSLPIVIFLALAYRGGNPAPKQLTVMYRNFAVTVGLMVLTGIATLSLLAPVWLKLTHLTMANLIVVGASRCLFYTLFLRKAGKTPPCCESGS
jgi:heme A synthase